MIKYITINCLIKIVLYSVLLATTTILFADSDTNIDTGTCTKKLNCLNDCLNECSSVSSRVSSSVSSRVSSNGRIIFSIIFFTLLLIFMILADLGLLGTIISEVSLYSLIPGWVWVLIYLFVLYSLIASIFLLASRLNSF